MSAIHRTAVTRRTVALGLGVGAAALISLGLARPAAAQAPPSAATSHNYTYSTTFTTPADYLSATSGDIRFVFAPDGPNPALATITGGSLSFTGAWGVDLSQIKRFGDANLNIFSQTVTIGNSTPINGFQVPVSQWGTSFSLSITYADPPTGPDPSDFSVTLQAQGQADASLMDLGFNPSGTVTLLSAAPGVVITPGPDTPTPIPAVPEASTTVSLGLMLILGLGGVVLARKKRA